MREDVDVCIVGGGVVGLFCAIEQLERGKKVRIIDKMYAGSSRFNIGELIFQGYDEAMLPFIKYTHQAWRDATEKFGEDIGFSETGSVMFSFSENGPERLRKEVERDASYGVDSEFLDNKEEIIAKFFVDRLPEHVKGAKFLETDGSIDTKRSVDELKRIAIQKGAMIWGSDKVTDFIVDGDTIQGVTTSGGDECYAKNTLICSGVVWSGGLFERLGVDLPIRPARCHIVEMMPNGRMPQRLVMHRETYGRVVIKYQTSGVALVAYSATTDQAQATWSVSEDNDLLTWLKRKAANILPSLENAQVRSTTVVTLAATPDAFPYLGAVEDKKGLFIATGFGGRSHAFAAGTAKVMADLTEGKEPEVDVSAFKARRDRFDFG